MNAWFYGRLRHFKLTSGIIADIEKRVSVFYPSSRLNIINMTMKHLVKLLLLNMSVVIFMIFMKFKFYYVIIMLLVMYMMSVGYLRSSFDKNEIRLLRMFEKFVSELRYKYQLYPVVEEALREAVDDAEYEMMLHGQLLLEYLSDETACSEDEYSEVAVNGYFLTLYALCNTVKNYGDKGTDGHSVFLENLGYLKEEIHIELLKRSRTGSAFSGLIGTCILPVFAMGPIEKWAAYNMPEITENFESTGGRIITVSLGLITIIIYWIISQLKYPVKNDGRIKSRWVNIVHGGIMEKLVVRYMSFDYKRTVRLNNRLNDMAYTYNVKEFLFRRLVFSVAAFVMGAIICVSVGISVAWAFAVMLGVYFGTNLMLTVKETIMKLEREEEVMRFQNIILMVMNQGRINVLMILEQMETFAVAFKGKIQYLVDEYPYKGIKIFEEVKNECGFRPFERLMDSFTACDVMDISKAFDDIKNDRQYYVEKHKQDNEVLIENKSAVAKFIAFIPLYGVVLFKLILPFVISGLKMMSESGLS